MTASDTSGCEIKLYRPFGSSKQAYIFGHVFKRQKLKRERVSNNILKNAWEMMKRYRVSVASDQRLNVTVADQIYQVRTDNKGFFLLSFDPPETSGVITCTASLAEDPTSAVTGELKLEKPQEIIVSDIDDTILISHSTSLIKKVYTLLSRNFERRKPFTGVQAFYHQLDSKSPNQLFFYVSSSEWNLYDFIVNFCRHHNFPEGKFLLNDIKIGLGQVIKSGGGSHKHKYEKIRMISETYPTAKLTLIGDSGQKDAEIYEKIALEAPDRINEIYIRDLHKHKQKRLISMQKRLADKDISMNLFK